MSSYRTFWVRDETFTAVVRIDSSIFNNPYVEAGTQVLEFVYVIK